MTARLEVLQALAYSPGMGLFRKAEPQRAIQGPLRDDLITYLLATSQERAQIIGDLMWRNRRMADLLIVLESDDDLRTRFEMELLHHENI